MHGFAWRCFALLGGAWQKERLKEFIFSSSPQSKATQSNAPPSKAATQETIVAS